MNYFRLLFVSLLLAAGCRSKADDAAADITNETIMEHIEVLSDDAFEGRGTGTEGIDKAADYIIKQLKEIGAVSGVEDGSYLQPFPLLGQKVTSSTMQINRKNGGKTLNELKPGVDFLAWPADETERVDIKNAGIVYVGYGIQAPEEDWDDFKGTDVKGKIIIIKNNDPEYDENLFGGKARLYYGRYTYKYEKAKEMGALGAIIVHTTQTAGYGWDVVENSWGGESFYVKSAPGTDKGRTQMNGWLSYAASKVLFERAGLDLDEQLDNADSPDFEPVELQNTSLSVQTNAAYRDIFANNIIAEIEGSDEALKDEYLVLSAHYDHLGITAPVNGDSINNGAQDNAAGVSTLLNLAKAYKNIQNEIRRSVLIAIVSAEEVGLLGSEYWAQNPTVHPGKISANINLDGTNVYGPTKDLVLIGYGRNSITDLMKEEAAKTGRKVMPDPSPELGLFYRSDHFNFSKVGIPAIFPNVGREFVGKTPEEIAIIDSVAAANYHSVSDEINEYWDLTGATEDARLFFRVGLKILNADEMQTWNAGDEFEAARISSLEALK